MYVDDLIVTGANLALISDFITVLSSTFLVKDLEPLHYFLGTEVHRTSQGLFLCRSKYMSEFLLRTNMHKAKSVSSPMSPTAKLMALDGATFVYPKLYCIVGSLQYLAFTRPDILFAVNKIC